MPYIPRDHRPRIDEIVRLMLKKGVRPNGELNYLLFRYCKEWVEPGYQNYRNFIAELTECGEEIRRRFLAPYEDGKIETNGDV